MIAETTSEPNNSRLRAASAARSRGCAGRMLRVGSTQLAEGGDEGGYFDVRLDSDMAAEPFRD